MRAPIGFQRKRVKKFLGVGLNGVGETSSCISGEALRLVLRTQLRSDAKCY
jgi:hypothetical protein